MIKLPHERNTDYEAIEHDIAGLRSPGAMCEFYAEIIERYTRLDEKYLFSESFDRDYVFAQLEESWSRRGRELFGIPFGVKDVFNTKRLPTTMGSDIWKGFRAGNNARVVDEIADRGGIIFSKTTTAEFAVHYIQAGRTRNPHDPTRITGTSSAGSAVAVACGALPICLGTQTAGSIMRPASFCGVYGFKPSFGAFDRTGTLKTTDTLDTIGLLGSDIYGLRKTFLAAFQKDPQYPFAKNYFDRLRSFRSKAKLRIGVIAEQFAGYTAYDSLVRTDFGRVIELLSVGDRELARVDRISFINDIHSLHQRIYCKSLAYYFQHEFSQRDRMSDIMKEMIRLGNEVSTEQYVEALKQQPRLRAQFDAAFAGHDFLVTPSTASVAPRIGEREKDDTCLIWTFLGYPVLSVPAFWSSDHNLPVGLQLVGPRYSDLALLEFGDTVVRVLREETRSLSSVEVTTH